VSIRTENSIDKREAWRISGIAIAALMLLTLVLYQQTVAYLLGLWNQLEVGNYAHGYLVLIISVYLVFYNRQKLALLTPCPEYRAIIAIVIASLIWLIATLVDIEMLQSVGLLLLLPALVWLMFGIRALRILAFPLMFISFAIPVWFPLSPVLQNLTADIVFWVIREMQIPALRIENMIVLPAGMLSIEEACGGLNYFLAAMTLGTLYAYLNYVTLRSRIFIVLVAATAAVLVNILRVFIVVYLGYTTDMQHPLIADHLSLGWSLFAGLVVVLLVLDLWLHKLKLQKNRSIDRHQIAAATQTLCNKHRTQFVILALAAALSVSSGPLIAYWLDNKVQSDRYVEQPLFNIEVGGWSVVDDAKDDWVPQYHGALTNKITFGNEAGEQVHFYMGLYLTQKQGEELINDLNRISDDEIWRIGYQSAKLYSVGGRQVLEQLLKKEDGTQRLVWYWYHVAGYNTVNKYQAKVLQVLGLITGQRRASVIAIAARLTDEPENTRKMLARFIEQASMPIDETIDGNN